MNRKETDKKTKLIQEKCNTILDQLLRDEDNKYCCDCDSKGPRWASWNLGIFLCIRCAGIHRNLGVHISRVKSVNLDTWAPEQVVSLQQMGNSRARAVYEALVADNFRRPQTDSGLESFIRAKYEQKKWIAREWVPPPPITKVDWDKEIEEELDNQKRKKKSTASIPEPTKSAPSPVNVAIPAPLPKPHSPKNPRVEAKKTVTTNTMDLLGLDTAPSNTPAPSIPKATTAINEGFDFFAHITPSSAAPAVAPAPQASNAPPKIENSLKQEEDDFFNQKFESGGAEKGKMTKDSILALYGNAPSFTAPQAQPFNANFQQFNPGQFAPPGAQLFNPVPQQNPQFAPTGGQPMMFNNGNFGTTTNIQQINKMNEENIKKIQIFKVQS